MALTLQAMSRTALGRQVNALRRAGKLPAVVYGHGKESRPLTLGAAEFRTVYAEAGETALIDLDITGAGPVKVLVQDVAHDPVTDAVIHVDFHEVAMDEEIHARIPLTFTGVAPAVKEANGVLVKQHDHVDVRALPGKLVQEIVVDLNVLATLDDAIHMGDLALPEGMTLAVDPSVVIATVTAIRQAEEAPATAAAPAEGAAAPAAQVAAKPAA